MLSEIVRMLDALIKTLQRRLKPNRLTHPLYRLTHLPLLPLYPSTPLTL